MRKLTIVFLSLALLATVSAIPAYAQAPPGLPHAFYGNVWINDSPALDGTKVSAIVDTGSVIEGIEVQNPVTTEGGSYGITSLRLLVQGDIPNGATITFRVNGVEAEGQTATFVAGAGPDKRDLSVTIAPPAPPSDGGGAGAPTYYTETDLFGTEARFRIDRDGIIQETFTATSADGNLTLTIAKGTEALDKDGDRLDSLEAAVDESPPDPPEDTHVIGLAYDFGPDGATFDPPITLTWSYDPEALPEGVAEEDLVIAYYDKAADEWVELDCVVDTANDTITASVEHFTSFAILGAVTPEVEVEEIAELEKTIGELEAQVASLRGDYDTAKSDLAAAQAKVASAQGDYDTAKSAVAAAQGDYDTAKSEVAASQAKVVSLQSDLAAAQERLAEAETRIVELEAAPPNWGVIGGIIAGVIVIVGLLVYFLWWRRRLA